MIRASEAQHKGRQGQLGKTSDAVTVATSQTDTHHFIVGSMRVSGRTHERVYKNAWAECLQELAALPIIVLDSYMTGGAGKNTVLRIKHGL